MTVDLLGGKRVVVAGIGPGLGRSIALGAAEHGADVVLVSRTESALDELSAELSAKGHHSVSVVADVTVPDDCARLVKRVVDELGGADTLVYNAFAVGTITSLTDANLDEWRRVMDVNVFGALDLIRHFLPSLSERNGSVVLINSRAMRRPTNCAYAMSKAALLVAGQALAYELGPSGVRVNSVVPGWMWAPPVEAHFQRVAAADGPTVSEQYDAVTAAFPLRRMPTSDDVANAVVFLASDQASAITGQSIDVNAGEICI